MLESLGNVQGMLAAAAFSHEGRAFAHQNFGLAAPAHPLDAAHVGEGRGTWETYSAVHLWRASSCISQALQSYPRGGAPAELHYVEFDRGFVARSVGETGLVVAICDSAARIALVQVALRVALFRLEHLLENRALGEWSDTSNSKGGSDSTWQTNCAS